MVNCYILFMLAALYIYSWTCVILWVLAAWVEQMRFHHSSKGQEGSPSVTTTLVSLTKGKHNYYCVQKNVKHTLISINPQTDVDTRQFFFSLMPRADSVFAYKSLSQKEDH